MDGYALAVWDFETLHDSVMEMEYGPNWFKQFPADDQPPVVSIDRLIEQINRDVSINWHDAIADWRYFKSYTADLKRKQICPIQVMSGGRGAERLDVYLNSFFERKPLIQGIQSLVLIGISDSLLSTVRRAQDSGLNVVGVGIPGKYTADVATACDKFIPYSAYVEDESSHSGLKVDEGQADTLVKAMHTLSQRTGSEWIQRVRIKPAMVRLDPTFDEKSTGYATFSSFLDDHSAVLSHRHHFNENEPEYRLKSRYRQQVEQQLSPQTKRRNIQISLYSRIAAEQGLRLPEPEIIWIGLDIYASFLKDGQAFSSFSELDDECYRQLLSDLPHVTLTDSKKVRQVLFKCFLFSPGDGTSIGFREEIASLEDIENLYFDLITARIARNAPQPVNFEALSYAVTGEVGSADRLKEKFDAPAPVTE